MLLPNPSVTSAQGDTRELQTRVHSFDIRLRAHETHVYDLKFWDMGATHPHVGTQVLGRGGRDAGQGGVFTRSIGVIWKPAAMTTREEREPPIQAYWLPYEANHTYETFLGDQADYFFTAGLSGCSVVASGDPKRPRVAHINRVDEDMGTSLRDHIASFAGPSIDMMPPPTKAETTSREIMLQELKSTVDARREGRRGDILGICKWGEHYNVMAAVFGIRDTANGVWSFYYQKYLSGPAPARSRNAGTTFWRDGNLTAMT